MITCLLCDLKNNGHFDKKTAQRITLVFAHAHIYIYIFLLYYSTNIVYTIE